MTSEMPKHSLGADSCERMLTTCPRPRHRNPNPHPLLILRGVLAPVIPSQKLPQRPKTPHLLFNCVSTVDDSRLSTA
eukprot:1245176-Pyramimonas_sp.AAC.1